MHAAKLFELTGFELNSVCLS